MPVKIICALLVGFSLLFSLSFQAQASNGIRVIGSDARQTALGGAGVANPMTPNAPFLNPAGIRNAQDQVELGFTVIFPDLAMGSSLAPAGNPDAVNVSSSNDAVLLAGGGIVTSVLSDRFSLGVSFYSSGGIQVEYPVSRISSAITNNRYDNTTLYANLKIIPTFAFEVLDNLTIGAGLDINYAFLEVNSAVPAPGFPETIGMSRFDSTLGIGGRIGLIYEPTKWLKIGATYIFRSHFQRFDRYTDLLPTGVDLPQQVAFGLAFFPMEGMSILTDFRWMDWSSGIIGTAVPQGGFGWRDQYIAAIGFAYDFAPKFHFPIEFRVGYNYGRTPIANPVAFPNLLFPPIVEHNLGVGMGVDFNRYLGVDLAYLREFPFTITDDGSITPAGAGAFTSAAANSFAMAIRGHWGKSAQKRGER